MVSSSALRVRIHKAWQPHTEAHFVAPSRLPRASQRQCLIFTCTETLPKDLTWNTPRAKAQTPSRQDPAHPQEDLEEQQPLLRCSLLCGKLLHSRPHTVVKANLHSQPASGAAPCPVGQ